MATEGQAAHLASLDACRSPQVLHLASRRLRRHQNACTLLRRTSLTINHACLGGARPCLLVVTGRSCACQCWQGMSCTELQQAVSLYGPQPPALDVQCPAGVQDADSWLHLFWLRRPCKCRAWLTMQVRQDWHDTSASRQAGLDSLSTIRVPQAASTNPLCAHRWCTKMVPDKTHLWADSGTLSCPVGREAACRRPLICHRGSICWRAACMARHQQLQLGHQGVAQGSPLMQLQLQGLGPSYHRHAAGELGQAELLTSICIAPHPT